MPHDSKGRLVKEGDLVTLQATIHGISPGEKACNCTFHVLVPPGIDEEYKPSFAANTRLGTLGPGPAPGPLESVPEQKPVHPAVAGVLQFFAFSHLPPHLQEVSRPFCVLAAQIANGPSNAETTVALRKLLEAKDAAVRALLFKS